MHTEMSNADFLDLQSVKDAAFIAKIHVKTIYRLIARGEIHAWGRTNSYRVSLPELLPPVLPGTRRRKK
jgi:hypothetical protein